MHRGRGICLVAAAALTGGGCFNPAARDDTGSETATTAAATTTSTGSATRTTATTTTPPDGTTTTGAPTTGLPGTTSSAEESSDGTTTAGPPVEFVARPPILFTGAYGVVTADLNKDLAQDVVISSALASDPVFLSYFGPDLETFEPHTSGIAVAFTGVDLDGNGATDIISALIGVPAVVVAYRRAGDVFLDSAGTVLPAQCMNPNWIAVGQLNPGTDMYIDAVIACTDYDGGVLIVPGESAGKFGMPLPVPYGVTVSSVALAHVRGGPELDLILVSETDDVVYVIPGADDLAFDPMMAQVIPVPQPFSVALAALDGDEFTDFAVVSKVGGCPLFHGAATTLLAPELHPCGAGPVDLVLGDLNRDKLTDLVSLHPGELHIAYGEAAGGIGSPEVLASAAAPYRVTLGDYDGDTRPDIALTAPGEVHVFMQSAD